MIDLYAYLAERPYPGRGIVLGRSADNKRAVLVYFIMGRSENSRNRVFVETADGIETRAFDESKMSDPSLIIYHPVRELGSSTIVTNGDQTDTVRDGLAHGETFAAALRTREFEPDGPNWTPRISGLLLPNGSYALSILKSTDGSPDCCSRYFYEYDHPIAGMGHFISTYVGGGDPVPSFQGEPVAFVLENESAGEIADKIWFSLNADNRVSLFARTIDLDGGRRETVIINKHNKG